MSLRFFVLLALAAAVVMAQTGTDAPSTSTVVPAVQPYDAAICDKTDKYEKFDKSEYYKSAFLGTKKLCVKKYLDVCATITGAVTCNKYTHACVSVEYSWDDAKQYPAVAATMAKRPEICAEAGVYRAPDTAVIEIAQIIFSGIFLIAGFVVFVTQVQAAPLLKVCAAVYLVLSLLLLFSYYYLNAIIVFAAVTAASSCFSLKCNKAMALGFAILLAALYWVTFANGLGYIQHHSRFQAGMIETQFYEDRCNRYYNGLFTWPEDLHKDDENIAVGFYGFCNRGWLAAELFFMILAEQLLVVVIAIGGMTCFKKDEPAAESSSEPTKEEAKPESN